MATFDRSRETSLQDCIARGAFIISLSLSSFSSATVGTEDSSDPHYGEARRHSAGKIKAWSEASASKTSLPI